MAQSTKLFEQASKEGAKFLGMYWTFGRYVAVFLAETKDEKSYMKAVLRFGDTASTETLMAVAREEAFRLLE